MKRLALILALAIVLLAACGGGDDAVPQGEPGAAAASTAGGEGSEAAKADGPSDEDLRKLFEALTNQTPVNMKAASRLTAPGSVAEAYVRHQGAVAQAEADGGDSGSTQVFADKGDREFTSCDEAGKECTTWADVVAEGDKVASFTTNGKPLGPRILIGGKRKFDVGGLGSARLISAYVSTGGDLWITLDIRNASQGSLAIESRTAYRAKSGRQSSAGTVAGPSSLLPDSRATYALYVTGGRLGGDLHLEMFSEGDSVATASVDIPIR